jgi:glycosyltransferase involved in cell wall biosynthesis
MEKWFAKYSNVITSVSKPLADTFLNEYGKETIYIPNGIHLSEQVDAEGAKDLLKKHEVEEKYILFASGRIIPIKGLHDVLEAAGIINLKEQIVILGDMDQVPDYKVKLEEQMKTVNSKHLGFISSKPLLLGLISKAELFVFPSTIEAMSMMLLEAASVKVPIICSNIPENKAVFDKTEVLFFKAGDPNDLSAKLKWANSNPDKMKELSENAYQTLKEKYTWVNVVLQYEELYLKLT